MKKKSKISLVGAIVSLTLFAGTSQAAPYTVKPGDTLWKIATWNGTTVTKLMSANGLVSDSIYPGQVLQVPGPGDYVVQGGDTMWIISRKFGIPLQELINANPQIKDPNNIWSGLIVHIPKKSGGLNDGKFPLAKGTYKPYTDNYGVSRDWSPNGQTPRSHEGVDIPAAKGTPVYSATAGIIINIGWNTYGGWRLTIRADDTTVLYYAHLSKYADGMKMGAQVRKGQLIGYVGNTGYGPEGTEGKFEPHLHFGIYKTAGSWTSIDPYPYLRRWELQNN